MCSCQACTATILAECVGTTHVKQISLLSLTNVGLLLAFHWKYNKGVATLLGGGGGG